MGEEVCRYAASTEALNGSTRDLNSYTEERDVTKRKKWQNFKVD